MLIGPNPLHADRRVDRRRFTIAAFAFAAAPSPRGSSAQLPPERPQKPFSCTGRRSSQPRLSPVRQAALPRGSRCRLRCTAGPVLPCSVLLQGGRQGRAGKQGRPDRRHWSGTEVLTAVGMQQGFIVLRAVATLNSSTAWTAVPFFCIDSVSHFQVRILHWLPFCVCVCVCVYFCV